MIIDIKPYDYDAIDDIFQELFYSKDIKEDNTRGLIEIPAASYQLIASGLKQAAWMAESKEDREIIKRACALIETMRDKQKDVERQRQV